MKLSDNVKTAIGGLSFLAMVLMTIVQWRVANQNYDVRLNPEFKPKEMSYADAWWAGYQQGQHDEAYNIYYGQATFAFDVDSRPGSLVVWRSSEVLPNPSLFGSPENKLPKKKETK